jgi:hypothetical protein
VPLNARIWLAVGLVAAVGAATPISSTGFAAASLGRGDVRPALPAAFSARQDGENGADEPLLDLAAMVPGPDDLPDAGYAVSFSSTRTLSGYADLLVDFGGGGRDRRDELVDALQDAGWRQWYELDLSLPNEEDSSLFARTIFYQLADYEETEGAGSGYDLLTETATAAGFEESRGGDEIGDRSRLSRSVGTDGASGRRYRLLDLTFQVGGLVARIVIVDWENDSPAASEAMALGTDLADRIAAVVEDGGPELGHSVRRIEAEGQVTNWDWYQRLGGQTRRGYFDTDDAYEAADERWETGDVTDVYRFAQNLPAPEATDPPYWYVVSLLRFEDEAAAATYLEKRPRAFADEPPAGYANVEIGDAEPFGDGAALLSFEQSRDDDGNGSGFIYYVRVDDLLVYVELSGVPDAPIAAIEALVEGQLACLDEGGTCDWSPPPEQLGVPNTSEVGDEAPDDSRDQALDVTLHEVDDSGVRGAASLTPDGDETEVTVELRGGEAGMVAVVQAGTCDDLDPEPISDIGDVDDEGVATIAVPIPIDDLLDGEHAIAVYASEDELGETPLACGEIEA